MAADLTLATLGSLFNISTIFDRYGTFLLALVRQQLTPHPLSEGNITRHARERRLTYCLKGYHLSGFTRHV